jgi:hypothetical protein
MTMLATAAVPCSVPTPQALRAGFLAMLPRIELHARVAFRDLKCVHQRQECIAETIALAWSWYCRLMRQGKEAVVFPSVLAGFAARCVRRGRRLCGQETVHEVLSTAAQRHHGYAVERLPDVETLTTSPYQEALADNTQAPVPDQAAFRIDFATWLRRLSQRQRDLIADMARSERTRDLARRYGVSPGRVSQLRRAFHADWQHFMGEDDDHTPSPGGSA